MTYDASKMDRQPSELVPTFASLVDAPMPPPGERRKAGAGHPLPEIATAVSVRIYLHQGSEAVTLPDLMAGTNAQKLHKRLNALGDACGRRCLKLDREDGSKIAMNQANRIRAAKWLNDHAIATANVAAYFPGMTEGTDLLVFIGAKKAPTATTDHGEEAVA